MNLQHRSASFTLVIFPIDNEIIMLQTLPSSWGLFVQLVNFLGGVLTLTRFCGVGERGNSVRLLLKSGRTDIAQ